MKIADAFRGVSLLFLDTAPVIYLVEAHPVYFAVVKAIFDLIDQGNIAAVTSPVTLAECLVHPIRANNAKLEQDFSDLITEGTNTSFTLLDADIAHKAASLRANYNLTLTDAFQVSAALASGCNAFLTNDVTLKRVSELPILVLDELEL